MSISPVAAKALSDELCGLRGPSSNSAALPWLRNAGLFHGVPETPRCSAGGNSASTGTSPVVAVGSAAARHVADARFRAAWVLAGGGHNVPGLFV